MGEDQSSARSLSLYPIHTGFLHPIVRCPIVRCIRLPAPRASRIPRMKSNERTEEARCLRHSLALLSSPSVIVVRKFGLVHCADWPIACLNSNRRRHRSGDPTTYEWYERKEGGGAHTECMVVVVVCGEGSGYQKLLLQKEKDTRQRRRV